MKESRTLYASHFDTCPRRQQRWNLENRSQRSKPRVKSSKVASRNTCAKKVAGSGQLKTWNRTSSRKRKDWGTMVSELFFAWTVHHTSKIEDLSLRFPCLLQLQLHPASSFFVSLRDSFPPRFFALFPSLTFTIKSVRAGFIEEQVHLSPIPQFRLCATRNARGIVISLHSATYRSQAFEKLSRKVGQIFHSAPTFADTPNPDGSDLHFSSCFVN